MNKERRDNVPSITVQRGPGTGTRSHARARAGDRARGGVGGAIERPRQREGGRSGGGRRHAAGAQQAPDRRHDRDRGGRARRGAHAVHRRDGRATSTGPRVDIAVDPLEGTTLCAKNMPGAIATMAMAEGGTLLNAPDVYMEKIAIGPGYPIGVVDLDAPAEENIRRLAEAKGVQPSDDHRLDPRSPAPCRPHRQRAQGGRCGAAHHRRRRRGCHSHGRSCQYRHRHLHGRRRRPRGGAGGGGVALHRRPDAVPAGARYPGEARARRENGHQGPAQEIRDRRHGARATACLPRPASPTARCSMACVSART